MTKLKKLYWSLAVVIVFISASICAEALEMPEDTAMAGSIDDVLKALYGSLTFPEGGSPDLECFRSLFVPEALFIRVNKDDSVDRMTTESFIQSFKDRIKRGELKSFHESELFRRTHSYGRIAQVFSIYQKGLNVTDPSKFIRGINSIQLFQDGDCWRICGILWADERPGLPIPPDHLR